jgi:cobalt-zinc-cadmium efflux system outer membrane protein
MPIPIANRGAPRSWLLAATFAALPLLAHAEPLPLSQALTRALRADPTRLAFTARQDAARAAERQASRKPNPTLGLEVEDFAGTGAYGLIDRTQATVSYQQIEERGGKRQARAAVARGEAAVAKARREVAVLDLLHEVELAWIEAAAAESRTRVAQERLGLAERTATEVGRRVRAARDPLFAGARAQAQLAEARLALDQAKAEAEAARRRLSAYWDGGGDFEIDPRWIEDLAPADGLAAAPAPVDLAVGEAERAAAEARIALEKAKAVQDPTWRAGVRYLNDGGDVAFVVGGSIPLARHDTNQDAVVRARAERTAAEADLAATRTLAERHIARLQASLAIRASEARRLEAEILPAQAQTVDLVRDGFNRGGFSYLDVIEAQKALIDTKTRRLAVLAAFQRDHAELARLTGEHAALIPSETAR